MRCQVVFLIFRNFGWGRRGPPGPVLPPWNTDAMTDQPRPQGQLDVQRWLGRCMLRLQQYERLM